MEYSTPTVSNPVPSQPAVSQPQRDVDLPAYRYAKALCENARATASSKVSSFRQNWDYLLGRNQWAAPATSAAKQLGEWTFQGVVNWCFATIKTKAAMICCSPYELFAEPLDDSSNYYDRLLVKSVVAHDLNRTRFNEVKYDAYMSGSVTGVGITMVIAKPDPLTGAMATVDMPISSTEFYRDPSSDSITASNCRYVVWEPAELDMSTVREMFPSKAPFVTPTVRAITGGPSSITYKTTGNDDNLIYGSAGEFFIDSQSTLRARKAVVSFVWIRDESLVEELQEVLIQEAHIGLRCEECGYVYEPDAEPGLMSGAACPHCGGTLEDFEIPKKADQNTIIKRKYPYGRLIVYSGDTLLYDGENPYEIESVFPFAVYHHERIPGNFYGTNDVDLLTSLQDAQNRTVSQGIDYVRLAVNSPILYPVNYEALTKMGNGPNQLLPGPSLLPWQPYRLSPQGFDTSTWVALQNSLAEHFQVVSGLGNVGFAQTSSPPISATEAEIAQARLSDRMRGHQQTFSQYCSDVANLHWQLLKQFQDQPLNVAVTMPNSEVQSVAVEVQKLPNVQVKMQVNSQEAIKDKILGQNSIPIFTNPEMMASPFLGEVLQGIGHPASRVKEILDKRALQTELVPGAPPVPIAQEGGPNA